MLSPLENVNTEQLKTILPPHNPIFIFCRKFQHKHALKGSCDKTQIENNSISKTHFFSCSNCLKQHGQNGKKKKNREDIHRTVYTYRWGVMVPEEEREVLGWWFLGGWRGGEEERRLLTDSITVKSSWSALWLLLFYKSSHHSSTVGPHKRMRLHCINKNKKISRI